MRIDSGEAHISQGGPLSEMVGITWGRRDPAVMLAMGSVPGQKQFIGCVLSPGLSVWKEPAVSETDRWALGGFRHIVPRDKSACVTGDRCFRAMASKSLVLLFFCFFFLRVLICTEQRQRLSVLPTYISLAIDPTPTKPGSRTTCQNGHLKCWAPLFWGCQSQP